MNTATERIAALALVLEAHPSDPVAVEAAAGLRRLLTGEHATLDEALGLHRRPGQRSVATTTKKAGRDQMLCDAASTFWPDKPVTFQARRLATAISRYASSAWPRERHLVECPPARIGKIESVAWTILKVDDRVLGWDRIKRIVSGA